jgi:predicted alpha/beta superfamily hydrolase
VRALGGLLALIAALLAAPVLARPDGGRFLEYEHVAAAGLPEQRLTIWLPPGYDRGNRRYPVLYMHDGHNLFDPAKSNFNKVWAADKAMLAAMKSGKVAPHIIVGIWAPGKERYRQYLPQSLYQAASGAPRAAMDAMTGGPVVSAAYLDWLAGPLKHWVDASFRTRAGRDDTAIIGSSMGGLMSCYSFLERPQTYGRAGCVSSHWPAADPRAVGEANPELIALWDGWFAARLGQADGRRVWMDHGTATLDAFYAPYQQAIDARMAASGWQRGRDWESKVYEGAEHEENAWARRLPEVFGWLLRK